MARGHKTGGRKPGSKNKRTKELEQTVDEVAQKISQALGLDAFEGDAHAFLMSVYKNETVPLDKRLDAAKAAVRFEKPALAAVEHSGDMTMRHEDALNEFDDATRTDDPSAPEK